MDRITSLKRSENMRRIRSKNTKPEQTIRKLIYGMGYRFRLGGYGLDGKPDLVFRGRKRVIFVHGCFWHQHDASECTKVHAPKSNLDYWLPKLQRTKERDSQNLARLRTLGWDCLVVWECQLGDLTEVSQRIRAFLG